MSKGQRGNNEAKKPPGSARVEVGFSQNHRLDRSACNPPQYGCVNLAAMGLVGLHRIDSAGWRLEAVVHVIVFESAVDNARQQTGKLVNLMLQVFGGDVGHVLQQLRRDGVPARVEPFSYHLAHSPELLDPGAAGSFAANGIVD
jgi:hypothetical protein